SIDCPHQVLRNYLGTPKSRQKLDWLPRRGSADTRSASQRRKDSRVRTSKKAAVAAAGLAIFAAVGTAATASGATPSPNPKTATSPKTAEPESEVVAAAAALGVSPEALVAAIVSGKQSFAAAGGPVTNEEFAAAVAATLAARLNVTQNEAKSALATILHLAAADGGIDTASAGFRDVAAGLGVTAGQL